MHNTYIHKKIMHDVQNIVNGIDNLKKENSLSFKLYKEGYTIICADTDDGRRGGRVAII